jgi:transcriptional regulator with XRE-family HTH domain
LKIEIGSRLKRLRIERGLTQKELAAMVSGGLDYTYIGKIERDEQFPSLKILSKIGDALAVPVGYFFRDEATDAISDIVSSELRYLVSEEEGRELVRTLRLLHRDDLPLLIEIVQVLARHRSAAAMEPYKVPPGPTLLAAEKKSRYRKK